jgi:hypothetical protein
MSATHPLVTSNGNHTEDVSTEHGAGQTTPQWVRSHKGDVDSNQIVDSSTTNLTTDWSYGNPPQSRSHSTERNEGESNDDFKLRHFTDTLTDMANGHDPIS